MVIGCIRVLLHNISWCLSIACTMQHTWSRHNRCTGSAVAAVEADIVMAGVQPCQFPIAAVIRIPLYRLHS